MNRELVGLLFPSDTMYAFHAQNQQLLERLLSVEDGPWGF